MVPSRIRFTVAEVEHWLARLFIAADGARLREEDRKKAIEVAALLEEIGRALGSGRSPVLLVDAAAGKAAVGLLAAQLVLRGRPARVVAIERDPERAEACRVAIARLDAPEVHVECREGDAAGPSLWPEKPDLVVGLHACGAASDAILERALSARARRVLLVPCCTGASPLADAHAERLGLPRHAAVRRAFIESIVAAERTLRLEAAGWQTEIVPLVPPTVTPYNLLWRARHVGEPGRMRDAADRLARLSGPGAG